MAVNISDIAKAAGLSPVTVSFVLNGKGDQYHIARKTQEKITAIADRLGYRRNELACAIRSGKSSVIAFFGHKRSYLVDMLLAASDELLKKNYSLKVCLVDEDNVELGNEFISKCIAQMVDGVICWRMQSVMTPQSQELLRKNNIPVVVIHDRAQDREAAIIVDDREGMSLSIARLYALGHRRIGILNQPVDALRFTGIRHAGYLEGMKKFGLTPVPEWELTYRDVADYHAADRDLTLQYLEAVKPTAMVATSDYLAARFLQYTAGSDWRVPQDISLVGYGDIDAAQLLSPPLTTIRQDFQGAGRQAATAILDLIDHPGGPPSGPLYQFPVEFVERRSTGPVRS